MSVRRVQPLCHISGVALARLGVTSSTTDDTGSVLLATANFGAYLACTAAVHCVRPHMAAQGKIRD